MSRSRWDIIGVKTDTQHCGLYIACESKITLMSVLTHFKMWQNHWRWQIPWPYPPYTRIESQFGDNIMKKETLDWNILRPCESEHNTTYTSSQPTEHCKVLEMYREIKIVIRWTTLCWCFSFQKFMYLEKLRRELPTLSPLDDTWPDAPSRFKATSQHLKQMYHQWRVGGAT